MHNHQTCIRGATSISRILVTIAQKNAQPVPARRHLEAPLDMQSATKVTRGNVFQQVRCHGAPARVRNPVHAKMLETRSNYVIVTFKVQYKCSYGQSVALVGNASALGRWSSHRGQRMKWARGDYWTCSIMLPAGSSLECKYVIIDDRGQEVRWQEGSNMQIKVPATSSGLPVHKYDVQVSWCKNITSFRAKTHSTATALTGLDSTPACSAAPSLDPQPDPRDAVPVTAWALAKGSSRPAPSQAISGTRQPVQPPTRQLQVAVAAARSSSHVPPHSATQAPISSHMPASHLASSDVSAIPPPSALLTAPVTRATAQNSLVTALVQAATNAVVDQPGVASPTSFATTEADEGLSPAVPDVDWDGFVPLPSCQLSPASSDRPMSIVLPSRRANSPPVKISLSSSFSRLMEMPASVARTAAATATSGGCSTSMQGGSNIPGSSANTLAVAATVAAVQSNDTNTPGTANSAASSAGTGMVNSRKSNSSRGFTDSPSMHPSSNSNAASHGSVSQPLLPSRISIAPTWGHEYDVYAAAYGIPYMNTPFDLDAYAVYDPAPELTSTGPMLKPHGQVGLGSFMATPLVPGQDVLESVVQALHSTAVVDSSSSSPLPVYGSITGGDMTATTGAVNSSAGPSQLLSNLIMDTAANTAPALGSASSSAPSGSLMPDADAASHSGSPIASTADAYRQASRCSPSVGDWAGRTLIQLNSGRSLDEDSDEETADDDAALAHALTPPSGPADMAVLLKQLGTALGRSVRMRYDGADTASTDLLELDRAIALASSKLYRQRDSLLTGWVRKETRRQLSAAMAAGSGRPVSNSSMAC